MKRLIALACTLVLAGCTIATLEPGRLSTAPAIEQYPAGLPYDWLWVGLHPDAVAQLQAQSGGHLIDARICFEATTWPRYVWVGEYLGEDQFQFATIAGCTLWQRVAGWNGTLGWKRFISIGGGEFFSVEIRVDENLSGQSITFPIAQRVATLDQSQVHHDF